MKIQDKLDTIIQKLEGLCTQSGQISGPVAAAIAEAAADLKAYARENLNFFEIVEHLDHSIFVTDGEGNVLYTLDADESTYTRGESGDLDLMTPAVLRNGTTFLAAEDVLKLHDLKLEVR